MTLPPFWGAPGEGATAPDPIVWWFVCPVWAYLLALWIAWIIADIINTINRERRKRDS